MWIPRFHFEYGFVEMSNRAFDIHDIFQDCFKMFKDEFEKYKVEYEIIGNKYDNSEMLLLKGINNND